MLTEKYYRLRWNHKKVFSPNSNSTRLYFGVYNRFRLVHCCWGSPTSDRKDGYSFKGTQISRGYSFGKLNARFEGTENLLSARASSAQQYEQGCCKNEQVPSISESSQDPWDGISSIGLFASANAQTFEQFPEDESSKKKKKKRRRGFSLWCKS